MLFYSSHHKLFIVIIKYYVNELLSTSRPLCKKTVQNVIFHTFYVFFLNSKPPHVGIRQTSEKKKNRNKETRP